MDKEYATELYERMPLKIRFSSYFKYSFTFAGENDLILATFSFGGNSEDIYRESVDNEEFDAPKTFQELRNNYNWIKFTEKSTGKTYEHWES